MGTPIREILEEHAGGMRDGLPLPRPAARRRLDRLPGRGAPRREDGFRLASQKVGSRLGTGTMIVLDDRTCPVGMVLNLEQFFARESCGWCTPCREGCPGWRRRWRRSRTGDGQPADLDILACHVLDAGAGPHLLRPGAGAVEPLESALKYFRDDFERHIAEKRCPWR